jgi:hypothetical protein
VTSVLRHINRLNGTVVKLIASWARKEETVDNQKETPTLNKMPQEDCHVIWNEDCHDKALVARATCMM